MAGPCGSSHRGRHQLPVHHRGGQRHCHCGLQPRERHDPHDPHHCIRGAHRRRPQGQFRNGCGAHHRRRGVHGPLRCRFLHHGPQDRLLDRLHAQGPGRMEVPWRGRQRRHGVRGHAHPQQNLRLHRRKRPCSASGQCHGGPYRPSNERRRRTLAPLWNRSGACPYPQLPGNPRPGFCPWHVHPAGPQPPASHRRRHLMVCELPQQGCRRQFGPPGKRHAHSLRFHCRRCTHGRCERHPALCGR